MNKFKLILIIIIAFLIAPFKAAAVEDVDLYLFYGNTCPHCANEKEFLSEMEKEYPNLNVHLYEVYDDLENQEQLDELFDKLEIENSKRGVPLTMIGTNHFIGYNDNTGYQIENLLKEYTNIRRNDQYGIWFLNKEKLDTADITISDEAKIPILGNVNIKGAPLAIIAVIIGAVDGFNPCAMWVLLFLISMLLGMKDKKRMWIIGLTFLITSALVYMLIMVAWLNITVSLMNVKFIKIIIGMVALIGAAVNFRSYLKSLEEDDGCTVTDKNQKMKIFDKIKKFTTEKSLFLALLGVITLAISVNVIELACSAGLPVLFTSVLAANDLSMMEYGIYIFIYILFFLIDDIIIFGIAMYTLELTGISNKYSKYSHLIGGAIMALIGVLMILKPEWLSFNF